MSEHRAAGAEVGAEVGAGVGAGGRVGGRTGLAVLREALERQVESRRARLGHEAGASGDRSTDDGSTDNGSTDNGSTDNRSTDDTDDLETTLRRHADRSVRSARRVGVDELARLLEMSTHGSSDGGSGGSSGGGRSDTHLATGWAPIDALLGGGLRRGALHEWEGAGLTPLLVLTHLAKRAIDTARPPDGSAGGLVLWIGRSVWPSVAWLSSDPTVLRASVLVDDLAPPERLWAIDLALRAGGDPRGAFGRTVVAVIADGKGCDLAATRRLQLAAERGGGLALLVRSSAERGVLSAATTRWRVTAAGALSRSIGVRIELLRRKGLRPTRVTNPRAADDVPNGKPNDGQDGQDGQSDIDGGEAGWSLERIDATSDLVVAPRLAGRSVAPTFAQRESV